ncbi:MAG: hypothetical protein M3164_04555 [Actinomycetota bacterium]|nr:hypothetical protein [Actinomycetota bacterium]
MGLFDDLDIRGELERTRQQIGSPAKLLAIWAGIAALFCLTFLLGGFPGGLSAVLSVIIMILVAFPVAVLVAWIMEQRGKGS